MKLVFTDITELDLIYIDPVTEKELMDVNL